MLRVSVHIFMMKSVDHDQITKALVINMTQLEYYKFATRLSMTRN